MDRDNHRAKVLDWLRRWGSITPQEAWEHLRIYRLGARVHELRERGFQIANTEPFGKLARYVLLAEPEHKEAV